jgi:DNA-directed RNA polymerase specialized sigma24 family protein
MNSLTPQQRLALWLRFWQGYSYRQIQVEVGHKSVSQTYRLVQTALAAIREKLDEDI